MWSASEDDDGGDLDRWMAMMVAGKEGWVQLLLQQDQGPEVVAAAELVAVAAPTAAETHAFGIEKGGCFGNWFYGATREETLRR